MLGKPKFKYDDPVQFSINGKVKIGKIAIIDAYGTFRYSEDVCYDIYVESDNCLYKHIQEQYVEPYEDINK